MRREAQTLERNRIVAVLGALRFIADSIGNSDTKLLTHLTTPFLALAPQIPRVVDIAYEAVALSCGNDCTDCSDTSDQSDATDVTDIEI